MLSLAKVHNNIVNHAGTKVQLLEKAFIHFNILCLSVSGFKQYILLYLEKRVKYKSNIGYLKYKLSDSSSRNLQVA